MALENLVYLPLNLRIESESQHIMDWDKFILARLFNKEVMSFKKKKNLHRTVFWLVLIAKPLCWLIIVKKC